jgi:hypothetical protein
VNNFDIIFITETWLHSGIVNSVICVSSNYNIFRADRETRGGGVAILFKKHIKLEMINIPDEYFIPEVILCNLKCKQQFVRIVMSYRALNENIEKAKKLCKLFKWSTDNSQNTHIILGDFNIPSLNLDYNFENSNLSTLFSECFLDIGCDKLVNEPTRNDNILDLILCNSAQVISNINVNAPFSTSDHYTLYFDIHCDFSSYDPDFHSSFDFKKGNYDLFSIYLANIDWSLTFSNCATVDDFYATFIDIMKNAIVEFIPKRRPQKIVRKHSSPLLGNYTTINVVHGENIRQPETLPYLLNIGRYLNV